MKLSSFLILFLSLQMSASVWSQTTTMRVKLKNSTLQELFLQIEKSSNYRFFYNNDEVDVNQRISVDAEEKTVGKILTAAFEGLPYTFKELDNKLILIERNGAKPSQIETSMQQQKSVSGKVTDSSGEGLPGVSVVVKGTTIGTITDMNGNYSLPNIPEDATMQFSFIGMKSQEFVVGTKSTINVNLSEDAIGIEEVVAIGYGTQKKSDLTGAISSVRSEDLNVGAIASVDEALKGRIAGVQISQTSAEPGGGLSIRIRGANSITAGNEPLYVIDGLPISNSDMLQSGGAGYVGENPNAKNPLNSLNPSDIKSIEVLKDASATAIYGSRGANGVILVTTKNGTSGKIDINFDSYSGFQQVSKHIDVLNTEDYIHTMNAFAKERGSAPIFDEDDVAKIGSGTDWQNEIYRKAYITNNNLSVSGGNEKTKYYVSANFFDQQGVVKSSGMKKYILRVNLESKLNDRLSFGLNLNNSLLVDKNNVDGTGFNETSGPINSALLYDPTLPVKQPDGTYSVSSELTINNPAAIIYAITSSTETNRVMGNVFFNYTFSNNLSSKLNIGIDRNIARRDLYNAKATFWGSAGNGQADIRMLERYSKLLEYTMTYSKKWENILSMNAMAGITYEDFINRSFSAGINDFATDILGTNNLGLGNIENAIVGSDKNRNSLLSYLIRTNFSLYDKVLLTSSLRADGSSRFGENNKFGYFPSVSAAWKLTNEHFIPEIFSELKLRTSWGMTGNQSINNYASLSTFTSGGYALLGNMAVVGTVPSRISNPDLKWETTSQFDVGIDFGLFDGRISGSFDYFIKNTSNMLMNLPIPPSSGFGSILSNVGEMKNDGIELMVNSRNLVTKNFKWNTTLSFSAIKNEVTSIGDLAYIATGNLFSSTVGIIKPGLPLNAYYSYKVTGIFQNAEQIKASAQPTAKPGYPIYLDNGDMKITADDRVVIGNPWPDFTFGVRNTLIHKNLELDVFIDGQYGAELLNGNAIESMYPTNERRNRITGQIKDRWTPDNPDAKWPSAVSPSSYGAAKVNSLAIEDASYIRFQTIQLSYNLPVKSINFIDRAKIYITGQNLLMFTNYSGSNPEANVYGKSNLRVDLNSYPSSKVWIVGANINF